MKTFGSLMNFKNIFQPLFSCPMLIPFPVCCPLVLSAFIETSECTFLPSHLHCVGEFLAFQVPGSHVEGNLSLFPFAPYSFAQEG